MKAFGILIAAVAGLLLLSGTVTGQSGSDQDRVVHVVTASAPTLPAWHPPVPGWTPEEGARQPALPEGHPPIPKEMICPVTGAVGKPGQAPRKVRPPVEGLVRI
jgi:hypothetical protein